ncbi:hypothetical protein BTVI_121473 [Pitangus sulphuratus]|nr:hypothetical protein BTVI_121473 [Pitangus sulphuratus]
MEIPLQPMMKTMLKQDGPLHPVEVNGDEEIHWQHKEETHARADSTNTVIPLNFEPLTRAKLRLSTLQDPCLLNEK